MAAFSNQAFSTNAFSVFAFAFGVAGATGVSNDSPLHAAVALSGVIPKGSCINGEKAAGVCIDGVRTGGACIQGDIIGAVNFNE